MGGCSLVKMRLLKSGLCIAIDPENIVWNRVLIGINLLVPIMFNSKLAHQERIKNSPQHADGQRPAVESSAVFKRYRSMQFITDSWSALKEPHLIKFPYFIPGAFIRNRNLWKVYAGSLLCPDRDLHAALVPL